MTAGLLAAGLALGTGTAWAADGDPCTYQGQVGVADGLYCVAGGEQLGLLAESVLGGGGGGDAGSGDGAGSGTGETPGGEDGGGAGDGGAGGSGDGAGAGGGGDSGGGLVDEVTGGEPSTTPSEPTAPPTAGTTPGAPAPAAPGPPPPPPAPGPLAAPGLGPAAPGLANLLSPGAFGPAGGLTNGLLSPAPAIGTFDPRLLSAPAGSPLRTLAGADGGSPVTTASQVQALAFDDLPGGLGTPAVIGVLILSTLGALVLRHRMIRRAKA